jgi:predicted nucleotidyltransferase component of viral defense system
MKASRFYPQVKLLLRCISPVAQEACFALKGGTAINLFVRDLPRLSVDIDLTYLPLDPRDVALTNISAALLRIAEAIKRTIPGSKVQPTRTTGKEHQVYKLVVAFEGQLITIEPSLVMRGSIYGTELLKLVPKAENIFEMSTKIASLKPADLYGGKLCAAMDRQHPRDLFDMKLLLENEGITDDIRKAFVVYLAGHARPMHELLDPMCKDISKVYASDFIDMAEKEVSLEDLLKARDKYLSIVKKNLTESERRFLLSLKEGAPKWNLLGIPGIENFPAVLWKLANIQKMTKKKHQDQIARLKSILSL